MWNSCKQINILVKWALKLPWKSSFSWCVAYNTAQCIDPKRGTLINNCHCDLHAVHWHHQFGRGAEYPTGKAPLVMAGRLGAVKLQLDWVLPASPFWHSLKGLEYVRACTCTCVSSVEKATSEWYLSIYTVWLTSTSGVERLERDTSAASRKNLGHKFHNRGIFERYVTFALWPDVIVGCKYYFPGGHVACFATIH